jgi:hypothetical protein
MARREGKEGIEGFAEDLGRMLGTAQAKAKGWMGQRQAIARQLQQIRDTAAALIAQMGANTTARGRGRGRRRGRRSLAAGAAGAVRQTRQLSAKARKAISDAQKRRWAAVRAAKAKNAR